VIKMGREGEGDEEGRGEERERMNE